MPPVANDSGSAIGTAIDAQLHFTGDAKLEWDRVLRVAVQREFVRPLADRYDIRDANEQ